MSANPRNRSFREELEVAAHDRGAHASVLEPGGSRLGHPAVPVATWGA